MFIRQVTKWLFPSVMFKGYVRTINSQAVTVLNEDGNARPLLVRFDSAAITDGGAGYAGGCHHLKDNGNGTTSIYYNEGDHTSCDFNLIETVASVISAVVAGAGMTGGGTEGSVTLNVIGGRGIVVRADAVDVGIAVYNNTGGTLTVGTLVRLVGFTTTNGVTVEKADADADKPATHVVLDAITNNTAGTVYPVGTAIGVNTGGRTIGDPVYLDATTAGGFAFSAPTGADQIAQVVGVVKVVDASVGEIVFFPGSGDILRYGTSFFQALSITTAKLAADAVDGTKIADDAISLEHLDPGITPVQLTVAGDVFTTAGGDATEVITLAAIEAGDTAVVWVQKAGATPRTVDSWIVTDNTITVTMSGDPSNDHKLAYLVLRAAA